MHAVEEQQNIETIDKVLKRDTAVPLSVERVVDDTAYLRAEGKDVTIGELRDTLVKKLKEHRDELGNIHTLTVVQS